MPTRLESGVEEEFLCLAIETSNPSANAEVAVGITGASSARVLAVVPLREVGRNEDDLLPAIDRACAAAGVTPGDLRRVAVSIGPGGYTSLRVACAAGKMIAEATGALCVPIPSAVAVAHAVERPGVRGVGGVGVGVCLASKDGSTHLTLFDGGFWQPPAAMPRGRLVDGSNFPFDEVGLIVADKHFPSSIRDEAVVRGIEMMEPRFSAASCLHLAGRIEAVEPLELLPIYPREPDAVTLWRKRWAGG
jgi:tRNA threonylcarbamoyl adenosine modification protein YeaZ